MNRTRNGERRRMNNPERTYEEVIRHERHNIIEQCRRRMKLGEVNYGEKDVCLSEVNFLARDITRDYEEETLDRINYAKLIIAGRVYGRLKSKPRDFKTWIYDEITRIDEEMMTYTPPEGDSTWDFESWLYHSIHHDINSLINFRILRDTEEKAANAG